MAFQFTFRPVLEWPGSRTAGHLRKRAMFSAAYSTTLELLENELNKIGGKNVVIQAGFEPKDIRNNGWPRSGVGPQNDPGVIVSCQTRQGALSFPCDRFNTWEDNLRAIAKSLEALRMVDRYGVTRGNKQYKGFAQLPPVAPVETVMDEMAATEFISKHAGWKFEGMFINVNHFFMACRDALKNVHPDKPGGSHELFLKLRKAREVLNKRFGL